MRQHSVTLDKDKCRGCTNCLKRCPTEAIRVRQGKAVITSERCIDCGECIRVCPYHAKVAVTDRLESIGDFKYAIALPAPALYGQFKGLTDINNVLSALLDIGFDDVFEVARAAELVSAAVAERIAEHKAGENRGPLISSACPAIVRLIQVRFPELIKNIVDVEAPMEVAALLARRDFCARTGAKPEEVGCFFISPCAAKKTAVMNPLGREASDVNGVISLMDVYACLNVQVTQQATIKGLHTASALGVGWANSGGEAAASSCENTLAVDGVFNVIHALEEIENNKMSDLDFFEGLACTAGCVGGPLTFENPFVAKTRVRKLAKALPRIAPTDTVSAEELHALPIGLTQKIPANSALALDANLADALRMMGRIDEIVLDLPGLDCGSCGSPTCRALAEDIVRGAASQMSCIVLMKDKVQSMARDMLDIAQSRAKNHGENKS